MNIQSTFWRWFIIIAASLSTSALLVAWFLYSAPRIMKAEWPACRTLPDLQTFLYLAEQKDEVNKLGMAGLLISEKCTILPTDTPVYIIDSKDAPGRKLGTKHSVVKIRPSGWAEDLWTLNSALK